MSSPDHPDATAARRAPFLRRVVIRDYKSISHAAVELKPLTVLVGRNGSGKSNFLDALRFIADSLQVSLDHAIRSRGGIHEIRNRGSLRSFSIQLWLDLPCERSALYEVIVTGLADYYAIGAEMLKTYSSSEELVGHYFVREGRVVKASVENIAPAHPDRLYLVTASGYSEFRPVYDVLVSMGFYDFSPESMKSPQSPNFRELLSSDGSNIAGILDRISKWQPQVVERIAQYLKVIVPGVVGVERVPVGPFETLRFKQLAEGSSAPNEFFSWSMSDGTLRALGSLVAAFQSAGRETPVSLVGIEEPENSLHPAATAALTEAFREASLLTQILITSHSPDVLDQITPEDDGLLAVTIEDGATKIAPIDQASLQAIRSHLYTPGELLRLEQLEPDRHDLVRQEQESLALIEGGAERLE